MSHEVRKLYILFFHVKLQCHKLLVKALILQHKFQSNLERSILTTTISQNAENIFLRKQSLFDLKMKKTKLKKNFFLSGIVKGLFSKTNLVIFIRIYVKIDSKIRTLTAL